MAEVKESHSINKMDSETCDEDHINTTSSWETFYQISGEVERIFDVSIFVDDICSNTNASRNQTYFFGTWHEQRGYALWGLPDEPGFIHIGPGLINLRDGGDGPYGFMWQLKTKMAGKFMQTNSLSVETIFNAFHDPEVMKEIRSYYDPDYLQRYNNDEQLVWCFLLDGCMILHFIASRVKNDLESLGIDYDKIAVFQQDLLRSDNQIPFRILQVLMQLCDEKNPGPNIDISWKKDIQKFITINTLAPTNEQQARQARVEGYFERKRTASKNKLLRNLTFGKTKTEDAPLHLLEALRKAVLGISMEDGFRKISDDSEKKQHERTDMFYTFRSARELRETGIYLEPSETSYLTDVSFTSRLFSATLKLPPLSMDTSTVIKLTNFMIYESVPAMENEYYKVNNYVFFLRSLICNADDVKELISAGILYNHLDSDQKVVELFDYLTARKFPNYGCYESVVKSIDNYFMQKRRMKIKRWLAEVVQTHFRSPLTTFAVFAAAFVVILTVVQAYFAIFPRN